MSGAKFTTLVGEEKTDDAGGGRAAENVGTGGGTAVAKLLMMFGCGGA